MLSGKCRHAAAVTMKSGAAKAAPWHRECRGRVHTRPGGPVMECECLCHGSGPRDLRDEIADARRERLVAAGLDPDAPDPKKSRERGYCKHDHEMTPENAGPRGECRACKREASARCKARKSQESAS